MSEENKSFWAALPGILTGLATLIGAVTGLYVAKWGGAQSNHEKQIDAKSDEHEVHKNMFKNSEDLFSLKAVIDDPDGYTNVRSLKSISSDVVTKVNQDEEFYTYRQDGNW